MLSSDRRSQRKALKIDKVRSAPPDHRLDMKTLLLLTRRHECSLVLNSSKQSGSNFLFKQL